MKGIAVKAIAMHIGSQIAELDPFDAAFARMRDLLAILRKDGITIERLDIGGGLGVPYDREGDPTPMPPGGLRRRHRPQPWGSGLQAGAGAGPPHHRQRGRAAEPGGTPEGRRDAYLPYLRRRHERSGPPGHVRRLPRHRAGPRRRAGCGGGTCGCRRPDLREQRRLRQAAALPPMQAGDLLVFRTAGAYGATMSNMYNGRPLVPEVLVKGDEYAVVRRRPTWQEMIALENPAPWQE